MMDTFGYEVFETYLNEAAKYADWVATDLVELHKLMEKDQDLAAKLIAEHVDPKHCYALMQLCVNCIERANEMVLNTKSLGEL